MSTRWSGSNAPRGDDYDARWKALEATGTQIHGEADCVAWLCRDVPPPARVLDAGCGTGRVAIELAARGFATVGIDVDDAMLEAARRKAPTLDWRRGDLSRLALPAEFDAVVMAGNVMIFVAPGTEAAVLEQLAAALKPGGLLVAGFQLDRSRLSLAQYDGDAAAAGLEFVARYATWDRHACGDGDDYAVSVHRRPTARSGHRR